MKLPGFVIKPGREKNCRMSFRLSTKTMLTFLYGTKREIEKLK